LGPKEEEGGIQATGNHASGERKGISRAPSKRKDNGKNIKHSPAQWAKGGEAAPFLPSKCSWTKDAAVRRGTGKNVKGGKGGGMTLKSFHQKLDREGLCLQMNPNENPKRPRDKTGEEGGAASRNASNRLHVP